MSRIGDCPRFGDCPRALNEAVIGGCTKDLIYKNKKPFILDIGSLGETSMTSFHI